MKCFSNKNNFFLLPNQMTNSGMTITPDLGTFAPLFMRINAKIFCFLDFLALYQLKFFYKLHNSTKLDKGYRLVYKLSCLVGKKNSTFFLVNLVKICLKIFNFTKKKSNFFFPTRHDNLYTNQ
jgi:hypothetical protein